MNILVSGCLLGLNCRYDGKNCLNEKVVALKNNFNLIPICPEQMGGLTTPRLPSEIVSDKLLMKDGTDVTNNYNNGAEMALKLALINDCKYALLKSKSPSCGKGMVYDGTFSGKLIEGDGNTTKYLKANGIKVYSDLEIDEFLKELNIG